MFEFVHTAPETSTTVRRFALAAHRAGYDALVVRNHLDGDADVDDAVPDVPDDTAVPVYVGVEVRADGVESLHDGIRRAVAADVDLVAVHGGDEATNRVAVEHGDVDMLAHPNRTEGGNGRSFDHVLAREAAKNGVAVELSLAPVLRGSGGERVAAIRDIHDTVRLVGKYDAPTVVSGDASSHLELRAPREMRAVARLVGIDTDDFDRATSHTPRALLADDDAHVEVVE